MSCDCDFLRLVHCRFFPCFSSLARRTSIGVGSVAKERLRSRQNVFGNSEIIISKKLHSDPRQPHRSVGWSRGLRLRFFRRSRPSAPSARGGQHQRKFRVSGQGKRDVPCFLWSPAALFLHSCDEVVGSPGHMSPRNSVCLFRSLYISHVPHCATGLIMVMIINV